MRQYTQIRLPKTEPVQRYLDYTVACTFSQPQSSWKFMGISGEKRLQKWEPKFERGRFAAGFKDCMVQFGIETVSEIDAVNFQ